MGKLNSRIDLLVDALKKAEQSIAKQIVGKKPSNEGNTDNKSIADSFLIDIQ